jgi:hypothetical protein
VNQCPLSAVQAPKHCLALHLNDHGGTIEALNHEIELITSHARRGLRRLLRVHRCVPIEINPTLAVDIFSVHRAPSARGDIADRRRVPTPC